MSLGNNETFPLGHARRRQRRLREAHLYRKSEKAALRYILAALAPDGNPARAHQSERTFVSSVLLWNWPVACICYLLTFPFCLCARLPKRSRLLFLFSFLPFRSLSTLLFSAPFHFLFNSDCCSVCSGFSFGVALFFRLAFIPISLFNLGAVTRRSMQLRNARLSLRQIVE